MNFARTLLITSFTCLFALQIHGQSPTEVIDGSKAFRESGTLPAHIKEASGLEITGSDTLWTHNDGGIPILYGVDKTGKILKTVQLNHPNAGWEDLTLDVKGNLYVGGFGNNKNDKRALKIYRVPNPSLIKEPVVTAEIIEYTYGAQRQYPEHPARRNFDADAFIAFNDSLYIFSKNRTNPFTGYTVIYSLPQEPGKHTAHAVDSIYLGKGSMMDYWVTAADISPDGKTLVLLSHRHLWLVKNFDGNRFSTGTITRVDLGHFSHKAGLCFAGNSLLYIVDEREFNMIGGKLYELDLDQIAPRQ